ncbi:transketolase [Conexibacter sp. CPCC 206217]|uniref:transketolase n=1 Tax=Conexibacter sp. CPCC 206217 TaxID=3064574 RepID=UPI00271C4D46|nr:transketolase [Conexibacter sp. CPCC 206217]MDO8211735.1 transketolase [Conexibacter sp. CPCC 206217]
MPGNRPTETVDVPSQATLDEIRRIAALVRHETVRLIEVAGSGHYTSVFSCAELLGALYGGVLRLSSDPDWPQRDRLVLSKGHMAVGVYPLLAERGYFPADWLDGYTRVGNPLGDHPDMRRVPGIDFSSGSLGHGLSIGVGMAQAARMRGAPSRIWVLLGDQELNEGQIWEAAQAAGHFGLGNLVAIVDRNQMGLDGLTEDVMTVEPIVDRFRAFGWDVVEVDGHDPAAVWQTLGAAPPTDSAKPTCIVAHTVKGKGIGYMELSRTWHLGYLAPADAADATRELEQFHA